MKYFISIILFLSLFTNAFCQTAEELAKIEDAKISCELISMIGGSEKEIINEYKKLIEVYSSLIAIYPANAKLYLSRGDIQYSNLNNAAAALLDYNKAIELDKYYFIAYIHRSNLKYKEDPEGGTQEYIYAMEMDLKNAESCIERAQIRKRHDDIKGALADLNKGVWLEPENVKILHERARLKTEQSDSKGAIEDYSQILQITPNDTGTYFMRGEMRLQVNDYIGALSDFKKLIEFQPNNSEAYYMCAITKDSQEDYDGAIADYTVAIKTDKENILDGTAYEGRAESKIMKGDLQGAIDDYTILIKQKISNDKTKWYISRGDIKAKKGDLLGANADYKLALNITPPNYELRAQLKKKMKDFKGAIEELNMLAKSESEEPNYIQRAELYIKLHDYNTAMAEYGKFIDRDHPDFVKHSQAYFQNHPDEMVETLDYSDAYLGRGNLKKKMNDFQGAISDYNKAIQTGFNEIQAYKAIGDIKIAIGDSLGAQSDYKKALKVEFWLWAPDYNAKGEVREKLKDFDGAISEYTLAIEKDKRFSKAYINRGILYCKQGNTKDGCVDLQKAKLLDAENIDEILKQYCH